MRAKDLKQLPEGVTVYVDMDGVLADLFNHVGGLHDVEHYNKMTKDQWEEFFKNSNAYELFKNLPAFPNANKLLSIVKNFAGGYKILSSPLNFDKAGSIKGKKEWLAKHVNVSADAWVFEHEKQMYATTNGVPNILIDDYGVNIRNWQAAGGIAIKYQADEDSLKKVFDGLKDAKEIIANKTDEDIDEGKRRKKRRTRWAAYGPGPYGYYGTAVGYSGSGGISSGGDSGGDSGGGESINRTETDPVQQLKSELLTRKEKLQAATEDEVYDIIDDIMTRIAKANNITGKQLHNMWVDQYDQIPDAWIQNENFADGKKPGRKGLAKRSGVNTKASVSSLRKTAKNSTGEKARMAHWLANMKAGRAKKKK